ncbi:MAG: MFS transporter [Chloroflexi bacterium]|nr:MFS transporter [Chloroflexota bacterium]
MAQPDRSALRTPTIEPPPSLAAAPAPGPAAGLALFSSLADPTYRWFWLGMLFSFFGMQMGQVARQWLVYELTGSSTYLGVVGAGFAVPVLLFSVVGGVVADRVVKKYLLVATQAATGVVAFTLGSFILFRWIEPWHIVASTLLTGSVMAFNMPGRMALIAELVPMNRLMNAVAINSAAMNFAAVVAPSVAGILVGLAGIAQTYYVYCFMYILSVSCLLMLPRGRAGVPQPEARLGGEVKAGFRYLFQNPRVGLVMLFAAFPVVFVLPYEVLLPVYARDILHMGAEGLGFMMGSLGIGALVGSVVAASLGDVRRKGWLLLGTALFFGLGLIVFANSREFLLSAATLGAMGAVRMVFLALTSTIIQMATPNEYRGRIMGIYNMTWGLMPLGSLPAGVLADLVGAPTVLTLGGCIMTAIALGFCFSPTLRRLS